MDKQSIYDTWVPMNSIWLPWVKPVLFAHLPRSLPAITPLPTPDLSWLPNVREGKAIVVDLPGVESVYLGLALAAKGYRPVPLFNAYPLPTAFIQERNLSLEKIKQFTRVDVESILAALYQGCSTLQQLNLPDNAPPAFLLDTHRQGHSLAFQFVPENLFDNRSVVFTTDFPSVDFLTAQSIMSMIVVRQRDRKFTSDLTYILHTWQQAKMPLEYKRLADQYPAQPLKIWAFPGLGIWVRLIAHLTLMSNSTGGFGGFIHTYSSG
ncbi:hypothetical protein NCWK1_0918 [Nostoc cycadae WK-1]|uniref:Uncharacterized protein n=2 Tax=Nostoc cycadae TaxID=246795 RepID=A0A2H6LDI1_9NOSO|nr:hypothetical protein NCWK1_0918 [Nostoc cycadae WK-1]